MRKSTPQCWLLSISRNGVAHPLAKVPRLEPITGSGLNPTLEPWDRVQIYGDLIAWTVIGESTDVNVYNWKTGEEVWQDGFYVRRKFIPAVGVYAICSCLAG